MTCVLYLYHDCDDFRIIDTNERNISFFESGSELHVARIYWNM